MILVMIKLQLFIWVSRQTSKRTCDTPSNLGSVVESKARYLINPQLWVDEL
ncbi:hypothetical protein RhiirB3_458394 [Rhizophagus irregularis]|nr:hypothetical protein RhiirB3_458394 [Rhizophagus irregularis]